MSRRDRGRTAILKWWSQDGLLLNRFGVTAPYYAAPSLVYPSGNDQFARNGWYSFKGLAGIAGNGRVGSLALDGDDYYIYHNDEGHHGGLHRWHVSNLASVKTSETAISWDADSYAPRVDIYNQALCH